VVANTTQGPDGRWTALDGRLLYRHAKTAGYLYQAVLRGELGQSLKVRWNAVERGTAEIDGVPRRVIEHFSRRRAEIVEHMAARGERSARAAQVATLETRRGKDYGVPTARLRAEWRARAGEHGLDHSRLRRVLRVVADRPHPEELAEVVAVRMEGADGLTRERSTFTRRELLQALSEAARPGAPVATLERQADAFLERSEIVELEAGGGDRRFTTRTLMRLEGELLESADQRQTEPTGIAERGAVDAALTSRPTLSEEQRTLVLALAREGGGVQVIRAAAGTGKTYALGAAVEAWRRSGIPVIGCALSARAACELRDQTGVDATTIARLRVGLARGVTLAPGSVLLVDEAGMVGTRDLAALSEAAAHAQAKIVLIGDDRQLPEIQAGGAFRALAERCGAIELREVRRQHEGWDRDALAALRAGEVDRFADAYAAHDRLVAAPTADAARTALVDDWWAARDTGASAMMIAHRRRDVDELNARARERMRDAGRLGPEELSAGGRSYAVGDRVVVTRNDHRLGIVNGQRGVVTGIDDDALLVAVDGSRLVRIPEPRLRAGGLDHGYALTAHRAQGATVDRTFVLGSDELYREWGYTALSRHRESARFYVSATPAFLNAARPALEAGPNATRVVRHMLEPSRAQDLAVAMPARDPLDAFMRAPERPSQIGRRHDLGIELER
jgi:Ti-type conjugative transfer relaxase TraA